MAGDTKRYVDPVEDAQPTSAACKQATPTSDPKKQAEPVTRADPVSNAKKMATPVSETRSKPR
ncbi:hypothetical protein AAVH_41901 [Aphelenchoides avenae]|nr:hypothetical protein AAVH_41901 [Aphelenchus avenae]